MPDFPSHAPRAQRWELTREALDGLLEQLGPTVEQASDAYEILRTRLMDLFSWEGDPEPEHLADETLNRLARRVLEKEPIRDLHHYAVGIARMVMLEAARSRQKQASALREIRVRGPENTPAPFEMPMLERCLAALPQENRELIRGYYSGDRIRLAENLGISLNALRNRALRIRERMFNCIRRERDKIPISNHRE